MKTVTLRPEDARRGTLILVNASHPLADAAEPPLAPLAAPSGPVLLHSRAAALLRNLLCAVGAGGAIVPVSGYRTQAEQEDIYRSSLRDSGRAFTEQYVALPGCSEHQTGLAVDLAAAREEIDFIRPDFPDEGVCRAFRRAAARYGFVERYRARKQPLTGIAAEPWHFRYVGYPHAVLMERCGLCLEEYVEYLRRFPEHGPHLRLEWRGLRCEVFHLPAQSAPLALSLPDAALCQISGDNAGGFAVTLWERPA